MTVGELLGKLEGCPRDMPVYVGERPMYKGETMFYSMAYDAGPSEMRRCEDPDSIIDAFCISPKVSDSEVI